jgi:hypothetical protein
MWTFSVYSSSSTERENKIYSDSKVAERICVAKRIAVGFSLHAFQILILFSKLQPDECTSPSQFPGKSRTFSLSSSIV